MSAKSAVYIRKQYYGDLCVYDSELQMSLNANPADTFTKALGAEVFNRHNDYMLYEQVPADAPKPSGRGGELGTKYIDLPDDYLATGRTVK